MVAKVVAQSREVKNASDVGDIILDAPRGKTLVFRLHILMEALRAIQYDRWNPITGDDSWARSRRGTLYIRSRHLMEPYLRLAASVMSLISKVQREDELASRIKLKYKTAYTDWKDYFYDLKDEDYCRLYSRLLAEGQDRRPIAMVVETRKRHIPKNGKWPVWCKPVLCTDHIDRASH
jgi:hypothetical protein